jgi:regulator of sigma E protease
LHGKDPVRIEIEPRMDKADKDKKPVIGVAPPPKTQLIKKQGPGSEGPYIAGTPAATAGFQFGDTIVATTDPDDPTTVTPLPDDWRLPGSGQKDYFEFVRRMQLLADKEVVLKVERRMMEDGKVVDVKLIDLKVAPMFRIDLGVRLQMGPILVVCNDSAAQKAGIRPKPDLDGDLIMAVSVIDADGKPLVFKDTKDGAAADKDKKVEPLDPDRLPLQLKQWSDRMQKKQKELKKDVDWTVTLTLRRHRQPAGGHDEQYEYVDLKLAWDPTRRFDRVVPLSPNAPMPIPELGLGYQIKAVVAAVTNENTPLKVGDAIKNIRYDVSDFPKELPWLRQVMTDLIPWFDRGPGDVFEQKWLRDEIEEGQWARVSYQVFEQPYHYKKLMLKVKRNDKMEELEIPINISKDWPLTEDANRGWQLANDMRLVKATSPAKAVLMGLKDTNDRMWEVFQNLHGMLTGRISPDNLGGPLTIGYVTFRFAGMDFGDLVFFLGLISINLAVVNFLPIPVLDGGHMVFLLYEKIRGQPASEGVRIAATYVGLAMILCLMVFVLYLDVMRLFWS